jgi:hypothetical protein
MFEVQTDRWINFEKEMVAGNLGVIVVQAEYPLLTRSIRVLLKHIQNFISSLLYSFFKYPLISGIGVL